jgi:DNA-binding transcriptional ArsR family regulator
MKALDYRGVCNLFKAFSHPTRIVIVTELLRDKKCVSDIRELIKVKQPNISQHLGILKASGIVDWIQQGKRKCYFLRNPQLIKDILKAIRIRRKI